MGIEIVASLVLYLGFTAMFRLIAFSDEPRRWWHPIACLLWPLSVMAWVVVVSYVWIVFGGRR